MRRMVTYYNKLRVDETTVALPVHTVMLSFQRCWGGGGHANNNPGDESAVKQRMTGCDHRGTNTRRGITRVSKILSIFGALNLRQRGTNTPLGTAAVCCLKGLSLLLYRHH